MPKFKAGDFVVQDPEDDYHYLLVVAVGDALYTLQLGSYSYKSTISQLDARFHLVTDIFRDAFGPKGDDI